MQLFFPLSLYDVLSGTLALQHLFSFLPWASKYFRFKTTHQQERNHVLPTRISRENIFSLSIPEQNSRDEFSAPF